MTKLMAPPREAAMAPERLKSLSDEELLLMYRSTQDRKAFAELVSRYERKLYSYLRRHLGDDSLAEDVFQATFLQVHLKSHLFEADRKFRPWLYTIAMNQAIDARRRGRRHRSLSLDRSIKSDHDQDVGALVDLLESSEPAPDAGMEEDQRREWVRGVLDDLPEPLREALELVYYQGLKYREAAEVLGIPVGTVKSRLHAVIVKLQEAWQRDFSS